MAISDILDLPWAHAYWTEGPEFQALGLSSAGGLKVGWMDLTPGTDPLVSTWPDEVSTADATQSTDARKPWYSPSSATFNNRPVVYAASNADMAATFGSTISQPFDIVVIGRLSSLAAAAFVDNVNANRVRINAITGGGADTTEDWRLDFGVGGTGIAGTVADTNLHLFRARSGTTDRLFIDEVVNVSGNAGASTLAGFTLLNTQSLSAALQGEVAFIGVASTLLTTTQIIDLSAWAASHYGTTDGTAPGSGPYGVASAAKFWVKADAIAGLSDGDPVGTWSDQSGNALNATQATAANKPTYKTGILNGLPVVRFDGTNDQLATSAPATTATNNWTMVLVVDPNTNASDGCAPLCNGSGSNGYAIAVRGNTGKKSMLNAGLNWHDSTTAADSALGVWVLQRKSGTETLYVDGVALVTSTQAPLTPSTKLTLGFTSGSPAAFLNGDIGEALVFDVALSTFDLNRMCESLATKWGASWTDIP